MRNSPDELLADRGEPPRRTTYIESGARRPTHCAYFQPELTAIDNERTKRDPRRKLPTIHKPGNLAGGKDSRSRMRTGLPQLCPPRRNASDSCAQLAGSGKYPRSARS